ncbi:MAG: enoyl-CoA hydratase [Moraxellaceae bacterium]|nr:enoyl-CoA hydratase [Moraxellaceae bacterium]MDF3030170.1 enoyl-CoA hydratase [Moraxellaceae bacterium]
MSFMHLEKRGAVFVLTLTNGDQDNTFNPDVLAEYHQVLDRIEDHPDNAALLITSNHPKTFCNGIDLPWLLTQTPEGFQEFVHQLENVLLRIALLDLPVIAAINGNCYAGGAILASACDFRFMREDRGRFCFSEVNIKIPFTPLMVDIIQLLPDAQALRDLALTGKAVGGIEAYKMKVADRIFGEATLHSEALAFAETMAEKHRATYATIKHTLRSRLVTEAQARGLHRA